MATALAAAVCAGVLDALQVTTHRRRALCLAADAAGAPPLPPLQAEDVLQHEPVPEWRGITFPLECADEQASLAQPAAEQPSPIGAPSTRALEQRCAHARGGERGLRGRPHGLVADRCVAAIERPPSA